MPSIPVTCMVCGRSVKDSLFPQHMQTFHSGMTQAEAIAAEKNIPLQPQAPITLDKDTPPSPDFMEVAAMLDKPKSQPPPAERQEAKASALPFPQEEKQPIILKYKYEGNCPKCNTPIKTVVIKPGGKWFAVAFCLTHEEITQQEVTPLIKEEEMIMAETYEKEYLGFEETKKVIEDIAGATSITKGKEVKKRGRRKSFIQHKATIQSPMPVTGLPGSERSASGN